MLVPAGGPLFWGPWGDASMGKGVRPEAPKHKSARSPRGVSMGIGASNRVPVRGSAHARTKFKGEFWRVFWRVFRGASMGIGRKKIPKIAPFTSASMGISPKQCATADSPLLLRKNPL